MSENFESILSGGHPNSLGRTVEVVDLVLEDRARLAELYQCYFSSDEIVRLRVSSAFKRVTTEHPDWPWSFWINCSRKLPPLIRHRPNGHWRSCST